MEVPAVPNPIPPSPPPQVLEPEPEPEALSAPIEIAPAEPRIAGKGGKQHRYLQQMVKQLAEAQGLKATIEAPLPDGSGQVDVLIERDGVVAAVEISVTTPLEWEQGNLAKCLAAGYPRIAVVLAKSKRTGAKYRAALLDRLSERERARVECVDPEGIPTFVAALAPLPVSETVEKGYRVRVSHVMGTPDEAKARADAVSRVIARSLAKS